MSWPSERYLPIRPLARAIAADMRDAGASRLFLSSFGHTVSVEQVGTPTMNFSHVYVCLANCVCWVEQRL